MACHYHPEREATDICAICGKAICKECGLEIAGKIYCKDCLEKIVGLEAGSNAQQPAAEPEPVNVEENIYQPQEEYEIPYAQEESAQEYKVISDDSPYNVKDSIEYSGRLESSYLSEDENIYQQQPEVAQNEYQQPPQEEVIPQVAEEPEYIYPDHSYEPEPTSARRDLEDKYEKYLDDLYFDEKEVPLGEQLAKDEEQYGSLTRKEYKPRPVEEVPEKTVPRTQPIKREVPRNETPEEMEARIRAEILEEQKLKDKHGDQNIHNLNYQEEKEPMGVVDILLTLILIIVILVVLYYVLYLFVLSATYPTFMDAVFALKNPQNIINHILTGVQK